MKKLLAGAVGMGLSLISLTATSPAAVVYDANAAFKTYELDPLNPPAGTFSTFAPFSVGYDDPATSDPNNNLTLYTHTQHTESFAGFTNTQGFSYPNSQLVPAAVVNVTNAPGFAGLDPSQILLHPGRPSTPPGTTPIAEAIVRFTAPALGSYEVEGVFERIGGDGDANVFVRVNGVAQFTLLGLATATALSDRDFDFTILLNALDRVDFVVNHNNGIGNDSTGLFATLTVVPEPTSASLVGLAFAALLLVRRRR